MKWTISKIVGKNKYCRRKFHWISQILISLTEKTGDHSTTCSSFLNVEEEIGHGGGKLKPSSKTRCRRVSREVLGQIYLDKEYLAKFLILPELQRDSGTSAAVELRENALEALEYIQIREEFWRQQNPIYARKPGLTLSKKVGNGNAITQ